jgi:hypothetical protein
VDLLQPVIIPSQDGVEGAASDVGAVAAVEPQQL